jgi:rare lipoprotein A
LRQHTNRAGRASTAACALMVTSAIAAPAALAETNEPSALDSQADAIGVIAGTSKSELSVSRVRRNVVAGHAVVVRGSLTAAAANKAVRLQARFAHGWRTVGRSRTGTDGRYRVKWRTQASGSRRLRVRLDGDAQTSDMKRSAGKANVYRRAQASWYGPGLYGNRLGCGGRLTPGTIGVAHKTLPCGARLTLRYKGRIVHARVIDRGPYVGAREFDLTAATKARLGFSSVGSILVAA